MTDHSSLMEALRRFARAMASPYDLSDVLHELCDQAVCVLGAAGAGVAIVDREGDLRFITASTEAVVDAERAQETSQEGPCHTAVREDRPVPISDMTQHADRWPAFCSSADLHGLTAVLGLPLVLDDIRVGSLNVYDRGPREWSAEAIESGTVLADIAAAYVFNATELARTRLTAEQLQTALDTRIVIEQAKGIVAAQQGMSVDASFEVIRRFARSRSVTVRSIAEQVVAEGSEFLLHG